MSKKYKNRRLEEQLETWLLKKGMLLIIPTKIYQILHNVTCKSLKLNSKQIYSDSYVNKHIKEGKLTRPVVIIFNHPCSKSCIVVGSTTNIKNRSNFITKITKNWKVSWYRFPLIIDKTRAYPKIYRIKNKKGTFFKYKSLVIKEYIEWLKQYPKQYNFLISSIKDQKIDGLTRKYKLLLEKSKINKLEIDALDGEISLGDV